MSYVTDVCISFSGANVPELINYIGEYFSKYNEDDSETCLRDDILNGNGIKELDAGTKGSMVVLGGCFNYLDKDEFKELLNWLYTEKHISCFGIMITELEDRDFIYTGYFNY